MVALFPGSLRQASVLALQFLHSFLQPLYTFNFSRSTLLGGITIFLPSSLDLDAFLTRHVNWRHRACQVKNWNGLRRLLSSVKHGRRGTGVVNRGWDVQVIVIHCVLLFLEDR